MGNWDSMPLFRRRVGGTPLAQEDEYPREHSEETVRKLKELGVTMAVIHFYKGYGLEAEQEHMADAKRLADLCQKYGIRVGVYVGSTIAFETFLHEKPEAREWFVPRHLGRPVFYGDQTFRKRVYFMHPGYREYMKRVLRIAIQDFHADLIHFDNTSLQAQAPIFFHPLAVEDFRAFLRNKYTEEQRKTRLGFSDVSFVEPPELERPPARIDDPLHQEWADFRCQQLTAYYTEMEAFIRGLNPETAVESNPHSGISGRNVVWEQGIDYPRFLPHMDVVWTEEGNEAGMTEAGILVSKIRTYKMTGQYGVSIFTYTGGARGGELAMAEAMAFNRQNLGMVGGALAGDELPEAQRRYIHWYKDNFQYYRKIASVADIAVLHNYASMAFNHDAPWESSMLVEQALIQSRIPFDIIFDDRLQDLSKYRALVLADQESLSDRELDVIRGFVNGGGGLLVIGQTATGNQERRRRRRFGLADLLHTDAPPTTALRRGRVVYLPKITPAIPKPPGAAMSSRYWALPLNAHEVVEAVKTAAGELTLDVQAPRSVAVEMTTQDDRVLLHLLNYAAKNGAIRSAIPVRMEIARHRKVRAVTLLSPEHAPRTLPFTMEGQRVRFTAPSIHTYELAVVETESPR